jgi:hypothetical protein
MTEITVTEKRGPGRPRKADTDKLVGWTAHLHRTQLAALGALAETTGLSSSALIRAAIQALLDARALGK